LRRHPAAAMGGKRAAHDQRRMRGDTTGPTFGFQTLGSGWHEARQPRMKRLSQG
jgi:hypothetical protein